MRELPTKGCNYTWSSVGPTPDGDIGMYTDTIPHTLQCSIDDADSNKHYVAQSLLPKHALYSKHLSDGTSLHTTLRLD
jgi:hypothetical protein